MRMREVIDMNIAINVKKIKACFAGDFGISAGLIEVMRPTPVEYGFKVKLFVFVGDDRSIGAQFANKMENTTNLAVIMKKCWNLESLPNISNTFHHRHSSQRNQQEGNEISLAIRSNIAKDSTTRPPRPLAPASTLET